MYASLLVFFLLLWRKLHDITAVISQMKDFFAYLLDSLDDDEWRPGSRLCNFQQNAFSAERKQFLLFCFVLFLSEGM